jgi:hypothetical protein
LAVAAAANIGGTMVPPPKYYKHVQNGTARPSRGCHDRSMLHNRRKRKPTTLEASIQKEMAQPRMARSAKIAESRRNTKRIPELPTVSVPGTVDKIIPSSGRSHGEKVQISIEGTHRTDHDLRIQNILTDENGDDVKLKKGARVEVIVTATPGS